MLDNATRSIPGIGKVSEKELVSLGENVSTLLMPLSPTQCLYGPVYSGVSTCGELLATLPTLALVVTEHRLQWLVSVALGIQSAVRSHEADSDGPGRKSIGYVPLCVGLHEVDTT